MAFNEVEKENVEYCFCCGDQLTQKEIEAERDICWSCYNYNSEINEARREVDQRWREEIEKYLPALAVMSFCGPTATIKWLFEHVKINHE